MTHVRKRTLTTVLLTAAVGIAAMSFLPAHAEHRYGAGRDVGFVAGGHGGGHRYAPHHNQRQYGWYAQGRHDRNVGYQPQWQTNGAGRVWCPTRRAYVSAYHNDVRYDDPHYDDGQFYDVWDDDDDGDDHAWRHEYYERDRRYRRW